MSGTIQYGKRGLRLGKAGRLAAMLLACLGVAGGCARSPAPPALYGSAAIEDVLPFFDGYTPRDPLPDDEFPPLRVLLSRHRYWAQDRHLDVVVQLDAPAAHGTLQGRILDASGRPLSRFKLTPPAPRLVLYPSIPPGLADGGKGELELVWLANGEVLAEERRPFRVERFAESSPRRGRVPLRVPNSDAVRETGVPVTVGVPFPRGTLEDGGHLRLVDDAGREIPLQTLETARWSKYGTVKWVLCDFTVDLDGGPRTYYLEYGPKVRRRDAPPIAVKQGSGFPVVDAGRLRIDRGLWFDAAGDGRHVKVLDEQALSGAFVEHEDGRLYQAPLEDEYAVEESGPGKLVIRRAGWYRETPYAAAGGEFCKYVTRYVIHRDSPLVRIFHTWIFTGDGNRDRIAGMGWKFNLAGNIEADGFLTEFGSDGVWTSGDHLLQYDYNHFEVAAGESLREFPGGRAPGVARVAGDGVRLFFGAKDFWQNYPSELEFGDGVLQFNNWPRHNHPARHDYDVAALPEDELNRNIVRALFAHEGVMLDFRLPDILAEDPVWSRVSGNRPSSSYWLKHDPESANAQGIARTEEMWLYLVGAQIPDQAAVSFMEGLNMERLRAVADPAWVAASGAFYELHHQDREKYPEAERIFELVALAPDRWIEWTEMYGMWNYGDLAAWGAVSRNPSLYRARRKAHHGWPYSWVPFARSGDSRLLKSAEAATRQMLDANYCHYVDERVNRSVGAHQDRQRGFWARSTLPWVGRPGGPRASTYETNIDYLLHAWYLTGYRRAMDVIRDWVELTKVEGDAYPRGPRGSSATLKAWLEAYEATFDPWFLVAAHATAESHFALYQDGHRGHFWQTGDREYMRFTDCPRQREFYMAYAGRFGDPRFGGGSWGRIGAPVVESQAFAWRLTGDPFYLARVAHFVDWVAQAVYDADEPAHLPGSYMYGHQTPIFTGWGLDYFGMALAALEDAGELPDAIGACFQLRPSRQADMPEIVMRKEPGAPLAFTLDLNVVGDRGGRRADYQVLGPDGGTLLAGEWSGPGKAERVKIPADAPGGDCRLKFPNVPLDVPVSDVNTPEVMVLAPDAWMPSSTREGRYWFLVPEGVERFRVECGFPHAHGRISIWGPGGERVWNFNYHSGIHADQESVSAEIPVRAEQAGRLWRLTVPGHGGGGFRLDAQIPPVFAADRGRWFMPAHAAGSGGGQSKEGGQ